MDITDHASFGEQLIKCREQTRLTQEKLALELDLGASMISRYETGRNRPSQAKLYEIIRVLQKNGASQKCLEELFQSSGYVESEPVHPALLELNHLLSDMRLSPQDKDYFEASLEAFKEYFQRYLNAYIDLRSPSFWDATSAYERLLTDTHSEEPGYWPDVNRLRLRVLLGMGRLKRLLGELDDANGFLAEAELLAKGFGNKEWPLMATVLLERGNNYRRQSRWQKAREDYNYSYRVFKEIEVDSGEKQTRYYAIIERKLAGTHLFEGQASRALENCERSLFQCKTLPDNLEQELKGNQHKAWAYALLGRWDEALILHKDIVKAINRTSMDPFDVAKGKQFLGDIYRMCWVFKRAKEVYDDAENGLQSYYKGQIERDQLVYGMILLGQGAVYRALHLDPKLALEKLNNSLDIHLRLGAKYHEGLTRSELGKLALETGNYPLAQREFEYAKKKFEEIGNNYYVVAQQYNIAELKYRQGILSEARAHAKAAISEAQKQQFMVHKAKAQLILGKINLKEPDKEDPLDLYLSAFQLARSLNPYLVYQILSGILGRSDYLEHEDALEANLVSLCKEIAQEWDNPSKSTVHSPTRLKNWLKVITEYREELEKSMYLPPNSDGKSHALLIGVGTYQIMNPLGKAPTDAQDMFDLLSQKGYPNYNLTILVNDQATKEGISNALNELASQVDKKDTVVLFFSGHGVKRPGGFEPGEYLCPVNADTDHLRMTAISGKELTTALKAIHARHVAVFLDACHSADIGEPKDPDLIMEPGLSDEMYEKLTDISEGRVVIASCGSTEKSWEIKGMRNGLFTHFLLEGLRYAAVGEDGAVRIFDLYNYISLEVPKHSQNKQIPVLKMSTNINFPIIFPKSSGK